MTSRAPRSLFHLMTCQVRNRRQALKRINSGDILQAEFPSIFTNRTTWRRTPQSLFTFTEVGWFLEDARITTQHVTSSHSAWRQHSKKNMFFLYIYLFCDVERRSASSSTSSIVWLQSLNFLLRSTTPSPSLSGWRTARLDSVRL